MTAGLSFSPSLSLGDTAPESGKPFKWFSRAGDNEDPELKLGENEKAAYNRLGKTNCKGCHDNEQHKREPWVANSQIDQTLKALGLCGINPFRVERLGRIFPRVESNPGLELANAFGVIP